MPPRDLGKSLQRTLTHLRPPPVKGGKFAMPIPTHFRPTPRFVHVKDRIPYWHIAPNDQVVIVKGGAEVKGKTGTVERVERETNRLWLKQSDFQVRPPPLPRDQDGQQLTRPTGVRSTKNASRPSTLDRRSAPSTRTRTRTRW